MDGNVLMKPPNLPVVDRIVTPLYAPFFFSLQEKRKEVVVRM